MATVPLHPSHPLRRLPLFRDEPPTFLAPPPEDGRIRRLVARQHIPPDECSNTTIYASTMPHVTSKGAGIGSLLIVLGCSLGSVPGKAGQIMLSTAEVGRGWVWARDGCMGQQGPLGFECFFEPVSTCTGYVRANPNAPNVKWMKQGVAISNGSTGCYHPKTMRYLIRPSRPLATWLTDKYVQFWSAPEHAAAQRRSLISVHIRWGDKGIESKLVPVQNYLEAALSVAGAYTKREKALPTVLLSSEDGEAIKLFSQVPSHPIQSNPIQSQGVQALQPGAIPSHPIQSNPIQSQGGQAVQPRAPPVDRRLTAASPPLYRPRRRTRIASASSTTTTPAPPSPAPGTT